MLSSLQDAHVGLLRAFESCAVKDQRLEGREYGPLQNRHEQISCFCTLIMGRIVEALSGWFHVRPVPYDSPVKMAKRLGVHMGQVQFWALTLGSSRERVTGDICDRVNISYSYKKGNIATKRITPSYLGKMR